MTMSHDGTYLNFSDGTRLSSANVAWSNVSGQPGLSYFSNNINAIISGGGIGAGPTTGGNCGNIGYGERVNTYQSGQYIYMQWYNAYNCYNCNCNCNCGKIICTKLYELGLLPKDIFIADQQFGEKLRLENPDIYYGYRAWAEIVVDWMSGKGPKMMPWMTDEKFSEAAKKWSIGWAHKIATPWAEEMAYRMGTTTEGNFTGKALMAAGIPICKFVGVWRRWFGASKKPAGFFKGALLVVIFVMFYSIAKFGKLFEKGKLSYAQH